MSYTDVAQVANAARNYEILHERDDEVIEQRSGDRHQPTSQQSSHRSHGHHNDHYGSDRRGGSDNHRSSNNNYSGSNNRHPGECRRAAGTCFKCGQAGHLQKDCKKNTTASPSGQADKKPGATGRVFAITEGHDANTSGKSMQIISALQARTLLSHGCEGFLATIHDTTSEVSSIHDQPIVSEFPDVFPDELPGIPPIREVEFNIELIPGLEPISKAPYRMAPIELKELKDQLQELL
nr:putative reverse transcriptase domain, aspartic peptidase domain protein [Tanacetum cinerariifolium]